MQTALGNMTLRNRGGTVVTHFNVKRATENPGRFYMYMYSFLDCIETG